MKTNSPIWSKPTAALIALIFFQPVSTYAQQVYDDAEGNKSITYAVMRGARIDSAAANPAPDDVNASGKCIRYQRTRAKYDGIHITPQGKVNAALFASYEQTVPKLHLKVYTSAPVGTLIELQLGKKGGNPYPEGTHSQYQARTTVSNAWQDLEFNFALSPKGSMTAADEIDHVVLLFNPNTLTNDVYYFDELTGPTIERPAQTAKAGRRK